MNEETEPKVAYCADIGEIVAGIANEDNLHDLKDFMSKCKTSASGDYNFLDLSTKVKYNIENEAQTQLFELLDICRDARCPVHILERVSDTPAGLFIDFDRKQSSAFTSVFSPTAIGQCATYLAQCITSIVQDYVDTTDSLLLAPELGGAPSTSSAASATSALVYHIFVTKRSKITRDVASGAVENYKDGIHIYVPDLWFPKDIRKYLTMRFRALIGSAFGSAVSPMEAQKMVDMNAPSVSPLLFGSYKPGGVPYDLAYAARIEAVNHQNCIIALSTEHLLKGMSKSPEEGGVKINLIYELCLTQARETFRGQPTWLHKRVAPISAQKELGSMRQIVEKFDAVAQPETARRDFESEVAQFAMSDVNAAYVRDLLTVLPITYAHEYQKWINVLFAIASEAEKRRDEQYKLLAQFFSMRDPEKWNPTAFETQWSHIRRRQAETARGEAQITIRSLEYWVRQECPRDFEEIRNRNARAYFVGRIYDNRGELEHTTIAGILTRVFRDRYVVNTEIDRSSRTTRDSWYEFVTPDTPYVHPGELYKWRPISVPHGIYVYVAERIAEMGKDIISEMRSQIERMPDGDVKKKCQRTATTLRRALRSVCMEQFARQSIEKLQHYIRVNGFAKSLDKYKFIIGVGNGVLEFLPSTADVASATGAASAASADARERFVPRLITGFHDYRISKFTPVSYVPYDAANPYIQEILACYRDIFPEPDVCEFILMYLSTWLDACDPQRHILLLGGGGRNGKTWSVYFPHVVLESYTCALKMQLLTEKYEGASQANSALMQLKDARGGYFDETNEGDRITSSRLKAITSPGVISGRELYASEETFRTSANLIAISNYDFVVNETDCGTWDRIYYYMCKSRFVSDPDPANPFEKKMKRNISLEGWMKDPNHSQAMLSILVHYRLKFFYEFGDDIERIPIPTIKAETAQFRAKQDPINRFIFERAVHSPGTNTPLQVMIDKYIQWSNDVLKKKLRAGSLVQTFQDSCIRSNVRLVNARTAEYSVVDVRIREPGDRLAEGETLFE